LSTPELAADPVEAIAEALAGAPVERLARIGGGRNSRVFRLDAGGTTYALKQYPSRAEDPRDRLGTEATALRWMEAQGLVMVPRLIAKDTGNNTSLLSWAEGALVRDVGPSDIDQAVAFLADLHHSRESAGFASDRLATEACLSAVEIERQLRQRVAGLVALAEAPELRPFLADEFGPALERGLAAARSRMAAAGLSLSDELPHAQRTLAPSDFGFHNALRAPDGRLTFIDFEYFGWDDPVKLTADILLHPGTPVADDLRQRFRTAAERLYGAADPAFRTRLEAYYPLFGLRWVLILLNEFHPERWRRRQLAGALEDWATARARQLQAARTLLGKLTKDDFF
jgi:hypothetical protein